MCTQEPETKCLCVLYGITMYLCWLWFCGRCCAFCCYVACVYKIHKQPDCRLSFVFRLCKYVFKPPTHKTPFCQTIRQMCHSSDMQVCTLKCIQIPLSPRQASINLSNLSITYLWNTCWNCVTTVHTTMTTTYSLRNYMLYNAKCFRIRCICV